MPTIEPLVQNAIQGNYDAYEQLVNRYKDGVYRISVLLLGSIHEGLDAAEEAFVRGYRALQNAGDKPLFFILLYRQAIAAAADLRKRMEADGFPLKQQDGEEICEPVASLSSFNTVDAQILALYEVEDLASEDVAAILQIPADRIQETLSRTRATEQSSSLSGAITELRKLAAPPGFSEALRDRLAIEAHHLRSSVVRKQLIRRAVVCALLAVAVGGAWSAYKHSAAGSGRPTIPVSATEQLSSPPSQAQEVVHDADHGLTPETRSIRPSDNRKENVRNNATPSASQPARPQPIGDAASAASIPTILLTGPKSTTNSLEDIADYVHPRMKSPLLRQGDALIVEVNSDQFWSMYRGLKAFYSKMRIPERAIPQGDEPIKIKLKLVDSIPLSTQSSNLPNH